jgi:hypothetical protein
MRNSLDCRANVTLRGEEARRLQEPTRTVNALFCEKWPDQYDFIEKNGKGIKIPSLFVIKV